MVDKLILGTVQLGLDYGINNTLGKPSASLAYDILNTAYENGIRYLDTAEAYGDSQKIIGDFHKLNSNKKFKIITKINGANSFEKINLIDVILNNCKKLNIEKLYGYMFHNYESFLNNKPFYSDLILAKKRGLIERVGISLYSNKEIIDVIENYDGFDIIQIPFNLLDNEIKRKAILIKAKKKGLEVHTRSVFLQGLFFMPIDKLSNKLKPLSEELLVLNSIKKSHNLSTETLALRYVLDKKYIDHVLIGVDNVKQLVNNINSSKSKKIIPHMIIDKINIKNETLLNPSLW